MLKTFFIWAFVVLPLAIALAVMLYKARWFILGIAAVAAAMVVVWGGLTVATSVDHWLDQPVRSQAIAPCAEAVPGSRTCSQ